jgi:aspartate-semialdehyde dehydrogenase
MKVAVVGATGMVGRVMCDVLEEFNVPVTVLIPAASPASVGKYVSFKGESIRVVSIEDALASRPDFALFSAGASVSTEWAPRFADAGIRVIDNSSAWRMHDHIKLVVPEINGDSITREDMIIANPNCSTIQMVMALYPLYKTYGIRRLVISTYQSFTGTGAKAVTQYNLEKDGVVPEPSQMAYAYPIFENAIPQCDSFTDNGYTKEELKLINETRKIFSDPNIRITATAVRIPVHGGHSESVNIEMEKPFVIDDVRVLLSSMSGVNVIDDIEQSLYPMPLFARNKNDVFVGRIRRDHSVENGLNMWIVADNLRKGAATNAVQIALLIAQKNWFNY